MKWVESMTLVTGMFLVGLKDTYRRFSLLINFHQYPTTTKIKNMNIFQHRIIRTKLHFRYAEATKIKQRETLANEYFMSKNFPIYGISSPLQLRPTSAVLSAVSRRVNRRITTLARSRTSCFAPSMTGSVAPQPGTLTTCLAGRG